MMYLVFPCKVKKNLTNNIAPNAFCIQVLQILQFFLQILRLEQLNYSPVLRIQAVTDCPVRCLKARPKVL
jgi:hypothetical protein